MFTKNVIITFLSLVIGIFTYFRFNSDNDIYEKYINYNFTAVPEKVNLNQTTGTGHAACDSCFGSSAQYSLPSGGTGLSYRNQQYYNAKRTKGIMVSDVADLVQKLKHEAKVI